MERCATCSLVELMLMEVDASDHQKKNGGLFESAAHMLQGGAHTMCVHGMFLTGICCETLDTEMARAFYEKAVMKGNSMAEKMLRILDVEKHLDTHKEVLRREIQERIDILEEMFNMLVPFAKYTKRLAVKTGATIIYLHRVQNNPKGAFAFAQKMYQTNIGYMQYTEFLIQGFGCAANIAKGREIFKDQSRLDDDTVTRHVVAVTARINPRAALKYAQQIVNKSDLDRNLIQELQQNA